MTAGLELARVRVVLRITHREQHRTGLLDDRREHVDDYRAASHRDLRILVRPRERGLELGRRRTERYATRLDRPAAAATRCASRGQHSNADACKHLSHFRTSWRV
jgi:hypothetical protein